MRKLLLVLFFISVFVSCSKEEKNLELKEINVAAMNMGGNWAVMGTASINGFEQLEENDKYKAKISYYVNLITPAGDTLQEIDYGVVDDEDDEEILIANVEVQVELDSSFVTGNYKMLFYITDDVSGNTAEAEKSFDITPD